MLSARDFLSTKLFNPGIKNVWLLMVRPLSNAVGRVTLVLHNIKRNLHQGSVDLFMCPCHNIFNVRSVLWSKVTFLQPELIE